MPTSWIMTAATLLFLEPSGATPETALPPPREILSKPQTLPSPRPAPMLRPLSTISFYRPALHDVWQNVAVSNQGFFRARAVPTPSGLRYVHDGRPYGLWPVEPQTLSPVIANPATLPLVPADSTPQLRHQSNKNSHPH